MLWVPQKGKLLVEHNTGAVGDGTPGAVVTTGATASAKGTPVELIASTLFDAYFVRVIASHYGVITTASEGCLDILIGAATEAILIPDLLMGNCGGDPGVQGLGPKVWDFPLYIPAGSRLAAQVAGARLSTAMQVWIYLYGGHGMPPFRVGQKVTTYGVTVPNGVTIVPGASGAEGSWTQIAAASSEDHFAFVPSFQMQAETAAGGRNLAVDLGVGAATEEEIAESYWFLTDVAERMSGPFNSMPCFQDVPSGTRLVMRASNNGTNNTYGGAIHALS